MGDLSVLSNYIYSVSLYISFTLVCSVIHNAIYSCAVTLSFIADREMFQF